MLATIQEVRRAEAPAKRPQALAWDGSTLWVGSLDTGHLYAIDPRTWTWRDAGRGPGLPWGAVAVDGELRVVSGEGEDDVRFVRRFVELRGFSDDAIPAPEGTGSQLSYDGSQLYLSQWYNKRILALADDGSVGRIISLPHEICGQTYVDGAWYCITTDDEKKDYLLTRVDAASGESRDIAMVPFPARALAYDGERFWTNHREAHQVVAFTAPMS